MPLPDQMTVVCGHLLSQILQRLLIFSELLKIEIISFKKLHSGGGYAKV
jgi:hypothetical protein